MQVAKPKQRVLQPDEARPAKKQMSLNLSSQESKDLQKYILNECADRTKRTKAFNNCVKIESMSVVGILDLNEDQDPTLVYQQIVGLVLGDHGI
jgi:hypothetical protein